MLYAWHCRPITVAIVVNMLMVIILLYYNSAEHVHHLREVQALRRLANHPNILELHEILL